MVATTDSTGTLISQQRYLPFGGVRPNVPSPDAPATDFGYTGQRNLDSGIGLMDYKARFYSPYINRFIQPDSIVPNPANPQSLNRFSYVYNNPIRYNDPTGHMCRVDGKFCDGANTVGEKSHGGGLGNLGSGNSNSSGGSVSSGGGGNSNSSSSGSGNILSGGPLSEGTNQGIIIPFNTDEIVSNLPWTSEQWARGAAILDEIALAYDMLMGVYVLTWVAIGLGGGLMFEGNPVTGLAGAAAGYIIGEGALFTSGALLPGNLIASAAMTAGLIADMKSGNTSIAGTFTASSNGVGLNVSGHYSTTVARSVSLWAVGWGANIVTLSLPLQAAAVANNRGVFSSTSIPVNFTLSFP